MRTYNSDYPGGAWYDAATLHSVMNRDSSKDAFLFDRKRRCFIFDIGG